MRWPYLILLITFCHVAGAQIKIPLCLDKTTYLYFSSPIKYVHCAAVVQDGEGSIFLGQSAQDKHLLQLIAANEDFAETNLLVKTENAYYILMLHYDTAPKTYFYEINPIQARVSIDSIEQKEVSIQTKVIINEPNNKVSEIGAENHLKERSDNNVVENKDSDYCDLKPYSFRDFTLKQSIAIGNGGIFADEKHIILSVLVSNQSGIPFDIDYFSFIVEDKKSTKRLKGNAYLQGGEEEKTPLFYCDRPVRVQQDSEKEILVVFEKFTLGTNQHLRITLKEKKGKRQLSHIVSQKSFSGAKGLVGGLEY